MLAVGRPISRGYCPEHIYEIFASCLFFLTTWGLGSKDACLKEREKIKSCVLRCRVTSAVLRESSQKPAQTQSESKRFPPLNGQWQPSKRPCIVGNIDLGLLKNHTISSCLGISSMVSVQRRPQGFAQVAPLGQRIMHNFVVIATNEFTWLQSVRQAPGPFLGSFLCQPPWADTGRNNIINISSSPTFAGEFSINYSFYQIIGKTKTGIIK